MKTLDDAWNAGPGSPEWETFRQRHLEDLPYIGPINPNPPRDDTIMMLKRPSSSRTLIPLMNNPYKIAFAQGDHTCTVADWTVTPKAPNEGADGKMVQPGRRAKLEFCTVAT